MWLKNDFGVLLTYPLRIAPHSLTVPSSKLQSTPKLSLTESIAEMRSYGTKVEVGRVLPEVKAICRRSAHRTRQHRTALRVIIVVSNVIYVLYNFEKNVLYNVIYAEKVICLFQNLFNFLKLLFQKLTKLSMERSMLQTWNPRSIRKSYLN